MTQEEARKFLMNKKVFVKDKSKEIQEKLFEIGFKWYGYPTQELKYLNKPFLFIDELKKLSYGEHVDYFYKHSYEEISAEDILNIKVEYLPKTWEEFCENNPVSDKEACIAYNSTIKIVSSHPRVSALDRNTLPSYEAAKAHRALMQLHQLRDCYRQGWVPYLTANSNNYCVVGYYNSDTKNIEYQVINSCNSTFLSFPTCELAEEFLTNFYELIEQAGDLI